MVDLNKLSNKIDELIKSESSDSLTKWLMNKRFGNISNVLGAGKFVSLQTQNKPMVVGNNKNNFNQKDSDIPTNTPFSRLAA